MIKQGCSETLNRSRIIRAILITTGTVSLVLGAIGIVLPLLPTTPFLLLAAACYLRSSKRLHKWLISNRWFGSYIKNYQEGKGIPLKTKFIAIIFLWLTISYSALFIVHEILIAQVALLIVAVGVSVHLAKTPTYKKEINLKTS
jgi:uncharacterized protein